MAKSWPDNYQSFYYDEEDHFSTMAAHLGDKHKIDPEQKVIEGISKPYGMPMDQWLRYRKEVIRKFHENDPHAATSHTPLISLETAMAELNRTNEEIAKAQVRQVAVQEPQAKTRRGKKNPEDRKPKGVPGRLKKNDPKVKAKQDEWATQTISDQQELLEQATTLMESYVVRIQVLELQVDNLRALAAKVDELDDRVNWLET